MLGQRAVDDERRNQADRQVQVEDPAPRDGIGDEAADQWPHNRRDAPDAAEHGLHPRPLGQRVDFADDRERERNQPSRAQTLHGAEEHELRHGLRHAGQHRPGEEQRNRREIEPAATVQVGQPAPERDRGGRRQEIGGKDPAVVIEPAEARHHGRHRGADDRGLERGEEDSQQQARRDGPPTPRGEHHGRQTSVVRGHLTMLRREVPAKAGAGSSERFRPCRAGSRGRG